VDSAVAAIAVDETAAAVAALVVTK